MHLDIKLLNLFLQNFDEANRSAKLIILSIPRIKNFFPILGPDLIDLDIESLDRLDAFRVRFCDLQDAIGNKVFRSLLCLEMESLGTNLDIINQIEKRGLIASFESWQDIRNIRNLFIHDYLDTLEFKAKMLNAAFEKIGELLFVYNNILNYINRKLKIDTPQFQPLRLDLM
jgi:hypothetical protein